MEISPELMGSVPLKFSQLAREKNLNGEKIFSLGVGEPRFETPQPIVEATFKAIRDGFTKYSNPFGLVELRELIKNKLFRENMIKTPVENIVVTPGAKQALLLALMAILRPLDEVINITPCYVSFVPQIRIAEPKAVVHNIDLNKNDFSINWREIKNRISKKTKLIIINSPHNPTGQVLSEQDVNELVEIVKDNGCYVISDEVYEYLDFSGRSHHSLAAVEQIRDKVITINGFSKAYAMTGWRIGYLVADSSIIKLVSKLQQHINTNTCTFVQKGACAAFSLNSDYIDAYNRELKEKVDFMIKVFTQNAKINFIPPKAGLFAFLNISRTRLSSDEFASKLLLKKNVAATPGIVFGKEWDDHLRVSLGPDREDFEEAIKLIAQFVEGETGV